MSVCARDACSNNHSCCVMSAFYLFIYVCRLETISHSNIAYFLSWHWKSTPNLFRLLVHTSNAHLSREQEQKTKQKARGKKSIKCHPALKFEMSTFEFFFREFFFQIIMKLGVSARSRLNEKQKSWHLYSTWNYSWFECEKSNGMKNVERGKGSCETILRQLQFGKRCGTLKTPSK